MTVYEMKNYMEKVSSTFGPAELKAERSWKDWRKEFQKAYICIWANLIG